MAVVKSSRKRRPWLQRKRQQASNIGSCVDSSRQLLSWTWRKSVVENNGWYRGVGIDLSTLISPIGKKCKHHDVWSGWNTGTGFGSMMMLPPVARSPSIESTTISTDSERKKKTERYAQNVQTEYFTALRSESIYELHWMVLLSKQNHYTLHPWLNAATRVYMAW